MKAFILKKWKEYKSRKCLHFLVFLGLQQMIRSYIAQVIYIFYKESAKDIKKVIKIYFNLKSA